MEPNRTQRSRGDAESETSPCFLLKICYKACEANSELSYGYVTVEHDGVCGAVEGLNTILDDSHRWDVSSNGVLVSFPTWVYSGHRTGPIVVCHPSLNWIETVRLPQNASIPHAYYYRGFRGAAFDPSTTHFTLLFGFRKGELVDNPMEVHVYNSQTCNWRTLVGSMSHNQFDPDGNGIFSHGCLFWLDRNRSKRWDRGIIKLDLEKLQFYRGRLPDCPAYPNRAQCRRPPVSVHHGWELGGCDGALVLVHNCIHTGASPSPNKEVFVAWRLDQRENTCKWDVVLHQPQLFKWPYKPWFEMDQSGWWLWGEKVDFRNRKDPQDLIILGDDGQPRHSVSMALLASCLGLPPNSYPHVDGLWVL